MSLPHKTVVNVSSNHNNNNNNEKHVRKGSDPLTQTARGKLQTRRAKLNDQINKELRMRSGAENLYRATVNKKLKEQVAVELSFFNSNIQLLKEELSEMNSSVEIYQHDNCSHCVPMIPLGLKETKEVDFVVSIKDFILEHYSEDGAVYAKEIDELNTLRQAVRTPQRTRAGVELLTEYLNQLYYVEKRFFTSERPLPIHFHWFDSLTGVPNTQKGIGFEKGSILFNIGALYSQIACRQDRTMASGLQEATSHFQRAAGAFRYLDTNFKYAPSMDMQPQTLAMLMMLMISQAQECVFDVQRLHRVPQGILPHVHLAQEAAMVSQKYRDTHRCMTAEPVKSYLPQPWVSMAQSKHYYYKGMAHYYIALALLDQPDSDDVQKLSHMVRILLLDPNDEESKPKVPATRDERKTLGKAHLREAVLCYEEALRVHDLYKQMRKIDPFHDLLQSVHEATMEKFSALEEEDDFSELVTVPRIEGNSEHECVAAIPEFSKVKTTDLFSRLGPITIFNAKNEWTAPRVVQLVRTPEQGFGFSVRGDTPVMIADLEPDSVAGKSSMKVGDFVVGVGTADTKWSRHDEVVALVRHAGSELTLRLVTPMTRSPGPSRPQPATVSLPSSPVKEHVLRGASTASDKTGSRNRMTAPWIFMRRSSSKEKSERKKPPDEADGEAISR